MLTASCLLQVLTYFRRCSDVLGAGVVIQAGRLVLRLADMTYLTVSQFSGTPLKLTKKY